MGRGLRAHVSDRGGPKASRLGFPVSGCGLGPSPLCSAGLVVWAVLAAGGQVGTLWGGLWCPGSLPSCWLRGWLPGLLPQDGFLEALLHGSGSEALFLFCCRPRPRSLAQKQLGPSPGALRVAPASKSRPTSLSEASDASSSSDSSCCTSALSSGQPSPSGLCERGGGLGRPLSSSVPLGEGRLGWGPGRQRGGSAGVGGPSDSGSLAPLVPLLSPWAPG